MSDDRAVRLALKVARVTAERDELEAARRLHEPTIGRGECFYCQEPHPCPTIRALNGQAQKPGRFA